MSSTPSTSRRLILALALVAGACTGSASPEAATSSAPVAAPEPGALAAAACALPHEQILRVWRGTREQRVGEILIVPKEPAFMDGGLSHAGPWDYVQRVPMLLYGPGYIQPAGSVARKVTMADVAPTFAELLGFDFAAPDGKPMTEALVPAEERLDPPRVIVTVVWDAGGRIVLDRWPDSWPVLEELISEGTWFDNATVGSSPSVTAPIHATLGTGAYARRHGMTDSQVRLGGKVIGAWQQGPALLLRPTLADLYDRAMGNRAKVGMVATLAWHLGMIGHGSMWGGGDRDWAVLRVATGDEGAEGIRWNLPRVDQGFYKFPAYVNDLPGIDTYFDEADAADGKIDGLWRGHEIRDLKGGFDTPARLPYQTSLLEEVMSREEFGQDEVPDLMYVNYKLIDEIGHIFTMNDLEMKDTVEVQDQMLARLVDYLNREVGEGAWVLAVTADHGHNPALPYAFRISVKKLEANLTAVFDDSDSVPVVQKVRPTQIYLDVKELERNGFTVEQVAQYLREYTRAQAAKDPSSVPAGKRGERVFAAAFPTSILDTLPCVPDSTR
jgi:hypothetical protein